jgi:hypothetical protein
MSGEHHKKFLITVFLTDGSTFRYRITEKEEMEEFDSYIDSNINECYQIFMDDEKGITRIVPKNQIHHIHIEKIKQKRSRSAKTPESQSHS